MFVIMLNVGVLSFAYPLMWPVVAQVNLLALHHLTRTNLMFNLDDTFCFCVLFQDNILTIICAFLLYSRCLIQV